MSPRVVAVTGPSGSGKTTLLCGTIEELRDRGLTVAAIKHTHHPINDERRGDTGRFLEAGATPVILAGEAEAFLVTSDGTRLVKFIRPDDLLRELAVDVVVVEGFKTFEGWPRIDLGSGHPSAAEVVGLIDRIGAS